MGTVVKLSGKDIFIDDDIEIFNSLYKKFHELSWEQLEEAMLVIQEMSDLDEIMTNLEDLTIQQVYNFVDIAIEHLTKLNIWNISRDQFVSEFYDDYFPFMDVYNEYASEYEKILDREEQQKQYRQYQRSNRTQWYGGGFGLSGAVRGAINAGVLNAVTGTFRFIGDSVVNVMDKYNVSVDKRNLRNSDFFQCYVQSVREMCENVGIALYAKLEQLGYVNGVDLNPEEVTAILSNLENHSISRENKIEKLIHCIKQYPYDINIYLHLFSIFGIGNVEVAQIARHFGFKYELQAWFVSSIMDELQDIVNMPESMPIECNRKRNSLLTFLQKHNILDKDFKCNNNVVDLYNIKELYNEAMNMSNDLKEKARYAYGQSFADVKSSQEYYDEKERERKEIEERRRAQVHREETIATAIKIIIAIVVIGLVFFFVIRSIPKVVNGITDIFITTETTPPKVSEQIQPVNPDEPEFFENTNVINYHRWFGGKMVLNDTGTTEDGIAYHRCVYSYENEEYPQQYIDMMIEDGFSITGTKDPEQDEKIKIYGFKKQYDNFYMEQSVVQVSIYYDRKTISIMYNPR